jgi:hypothetical protein
VYLQLFFMGLFYGALPQTPPTFEKVGSKLLLNGFAQTSRHFATENLFKILGWCEAIQRKRKLVFFFVV